MPRPADITRVCLLLLLAPRLCTRQEFGSACLGCFIVCMREGICACESVVTRLSRDAAISGPQFFRRALGILVYSRAPAQGAGDLQGCSCHSLLETLGLPRWQREGPCDIGGPGGKRVSPAAAARVLMHLTGPLRPAPPPQMASATDSRYGQKESSDQNFDYMFKILIIGNSSVGKTSFLFRYADDSFTPAFVSTVGIDFKVKTIYRNDKRIKLQIWVRRA